MLDDQTETCRGEVRFGAFRWCRCRQRNPRERDNTDEKQSQERHQSRVGGAGGRTGPPPARERRGDKGGRPRHPLGKSWLTRVSVMLLAPVLMGHHVATAPMTTSTGTGLFPPGLYLVTTSLMDGQCVVHVLEEHTRCGRRGYQKSLENHPGRDRRGRTKMVPPSSTPVADCCGDAGVGEGRGGFK